MAHGGYAIRVTTTLATVLCLKILGTFVGLALMSYAGLAVVAVTWLPVVYLSLSNGAAIRLRSGRALRAAHGSWSEVVAATRAGGTVVGGAWSNLLAQRSAPPAAVGLHRWRGRLPSGRWASGTTIAEVQRALVAEGKTMASYPTVSSATLGGWIASGSHGSGGTLYEPAFGRITVIDTRTGEWLDVYPSDVFSDARSIEEHRRYIIVDVEITPVADVWCVRRCFRVHDGATARRFLEVPSYLRMVFIGARGSLALTWEPAAGQPSPASRMCGAACAWWRRVRLWLQADAASVWQTARLHPAISEAYVRLSAASNFTPAIPTLLSVVPLDYINFEVFVRRVALAPPRLLELSNVLSALFASGAARGRCELRYGRRGKLFLDFGCDRRGFSARPIFEALAPFFTHVSLHKGKAHVDVAPLAREQ